MKVNKIPMISFLREFGITEGRLLEDIHPNLDTVIIGGKPVARYTGEFWTSKQRQGSSIHEISYRACFKSQLPNFFIRLLTNEGEVVYDPFSGRGTTAIEAGLTGRNVIANDVNPLSTILTKPRFFIPDILKLEERLEKVLRRSSKAKLSLPMFYHPKTEREIRSLRDYLRTRLENRSQDSLDQWIRTVATNRLTGHSKGFFSVYTLPPNQALTPDRQIKINKRLRQRPEYRNVCEIILKKSRSLIRNLTEAQRHCLLQAGNSGSFLTEDARDTKSIPNGSVHLTVTSPPFLNIVDYGGDNWLRTWFNSIDTREVTSRITSAKTVEEWSSFIRSVFIELFRLTKSGGWVAFEVGDVRKGLVHLEEHVAPLGIEAGFRCVGLIMNRQRFTKTSNIWGIKNNQKGTNSNKIVLFHKT